MDNIFKIPHSLYTPVAYRPHTYLLDCLKLMLYSKLILKIVDLNIFIDQAI